MNEQQIDRLCVAIERLADVLEAANHVDEVVVGEEPLSIGEAANLLDVSEKTARRWVKTGRLQAYKPGGKYTIPRSAVEKLKARAPDRPSAESG